MSSSLIYLNDKNLESRLLNEEDFKIYPEDLKYISCNGKQCDPTICLHTSCKIFEFWRNKKEC